MSFVLLLTGEGSPLRTGKRVPTSSWVHLSIIGRPVRSDLRQRRTGHNSSHLHHKLFTIRLRSRNLPMDKLLVFVLSAFS